MSTHSPMRPAWHCYACGQEWPCHTRQSQLLAEYDRAPVSLALIMSSYFVAAADEMPLAAAGSLHDRFVGWLDPSGRRG